MDYLTMTIGKQKNIALIAHDQKKRELIDWCEEHRRCWQSISLRHRDDGRMITDSTGLPVKGYQQRPPGRRPADRRKIVEGKIDFVIFFSDPLTAQPHDPDVKALLRIAQSTTFPSPTTRPARIS